MTAWEGFKKFYRVFRWVVLIGLAVVLLLVMKQAAPPEVMSDPQAASRVELKMYEAQQALDAGEAHTLELDEAELNTFLQSNLALDGRAAEVAAAAGAAETGRDPASETSIAEVKSTVRDVRINLVDDQVRAYVLFDFHGKDLSLILEGRLRVVDGYLRLEPTSGTLGSLPIPQATLDNAVARLFDSPENREKFRVPPHISDIRVEGGQLQVLYNQ
jgi:hypothetical protein